MDSSLKNECYVEIFLFAAEGGLFTINTDVNSTLRESYDDG